jgi:hypothetical protein
MRAIADLRKRLAPEGVHPKIQGDRENTIADRDCVDGLGRTDLRAT